jgi:L-asparaginase II
MKAAGERPTQLHNNCSGKHAAMLAFARHIGAETADYEAFDHRIQRRILKCISDFTEVPEDKIELGIDGCAAPNFAVSVAAMARSFANLVHPQKFHDSIQAAARRVVAAMIDHPHLIGGHGRLDTMLMQAANGKIISKVGAEGVWLCGVLPCERWPSGLGIAMKVEDGDDNRGRPVATIALLRQLGILKENDLADISPMPIKNRRGDIVGRIESQISLIK